MSGGTVTVRICKSIKKSDASHDADKVKELNKKKFQHLPLEPDPVSLLELLELLDCRPGDDMRIAFPG